MPQTAKAFLEETGIIAIARNIEMEWATTLAQALYEGGIRLLEITMNTPHAATIIRSLKWKFEGKMQIGAGTVINMPRLKEAVEAGASFIVTPNVNSEVITYCVERGLLIVPGVLTPSEMLMAAEMGCQYVKLFPANAFPASYLKNVRAALSESRVLVVGGVSSANIDGYLQAGAVGAGVGGSLCSIHSQADVMHVTAEAKRLIKMRAVYAQKENKSNDM